MVLWTGADQWIWGDRVTRLGAGTSRRFAATTEETLLADLRTILTPQCNARARALAPRMTKPEESVKLTADLLENFARLERLS